MSYQEREHVTYNHDLADDDERRQLAYICHCAPESKNLKDNGFNVAAVNEDIRKHCNHNTLAVLSAAAVRIQNKCLPASA